MISSLLLRVSTVLLFIGMALGIAMGIRQSFLFAPAHAHLNLVGGVLLFLAGLYYRAVPVAAGSLIAKLHAWISIIGAIVLPIGIGIAQVDHSQPFIAIIGSLISIIGMLLFVIVVFRTSNS